MSARPTLLIVSYHFAPSPLVGAKRFSFLAREFSRLGYNVHIVTNSIGDSPHGREDESLPICGTVHRIDAPYEVPESPELRLRTTENNPEHLADSVIGYLSRQRIDSTIPNS